MADNTRIEWADHTFNPWEGCQKVGPGCDHCYAETRNARFGGGTAPNWGPGAPRRRTSRANWKKPLHWNRDAAAFAEAHGRKQRVFCASLADVFDNAVPISWRADLFDLIDATPNLEWLLLTKRIGNVNGMLGKWNLAMPPHVWLGATMVNQEEIDRDWDKLMAAPAVIRFLSVEPMLGEIEIPPFGSPFVDWIICGGESGPGARPLRPDWVRSLRDQCAAAGVAFLHKQNGEFAPGEIAGDYLDPDKPAKGVSWFDGRWSECWSEPDGHRDDEPDVYRVGKKRAGRLLDGVTHDGFPS